MALAADSGGYQPTSWGWSAALLLLATAAVLVAGGRRLAPLELALPASLAALGAWIWLSLAWTADVAQTVREGERILVYVAAVTLLLLAGGRSRVTTLLASLTAAITAVCAYALATRLFDPGSGAYQVLSSDPQAGFRLARPLGYANALAIFAVIGILLALGFGLRARAPLGRALASAALVVLAPTLYFTYGRGAWLGLAAGVAALLAAERDRLDVLVRGLALAAAPAVVVLLASRTAALTADPGSVAAATHDGRRLAVAIVILAVAAAFVPAAVDRFRPGAATRRWLLAALALLAIAAAAAALVRAGEPASAARRAYHAFNAPAPLVGQNASSRLFSLSGSNRSDYWRVAWREWTDHPLLGGGAGSFQRSWLRHRRADLPVRDAHSLYLETLAELGPLGLALLLCALAVPLLAVRAARRNPLAAAALGAYVAYLVHAGIDWDWEMPAVTVAALACGVALLLAARGAGPEPRRTAALAGAAATVALACLALLGLVGNRAELAAADALDAAQLGTAASEARTAHRWEPWSGTPWRLLGESQLQGGDVDRARTSFLRGLRRDRGDWELWLDLALVSRGDARSAALARVAELNPLSAELRQLNGP